jgi:ParB family chromosome partitioning protein
MDKKTKLPRRRTTKNNAHQEDLIAKFQNGEVDSKRSQEKLDGMKALDKTKENKEKNDPLFNSPSEVEFILLDYMQPQKDNPRFLPVVTSSNGSAESIAKLKDCVVCEKGILENRLDKSHPRFEEAELEIEQIILFAESLKRIDMVHPITVWRANMSNYPIISGHRRYYAVRYLYGGTIKVKAKVYLKKPRFVSVLRHAENFSRASLAATDAITDFMAAVKELEDNLKPEELKPNKVETVCQHLALSQATFYRFDKLSNYADLVKPLFEYKIATNIQELVAEIKKAEKAGGRKVVESYLQSMFTKKKFTPFLHKKEASTSRGRAKTYITMPKIKVSNKGAIKRLLTEDVTQLDLGIDWDTVDLDDTEQLEKALKIIISSLSK